MREEHRKPESSPPGATADSVVFSVMMAIAAYLGRENPDFTYPEILYSFLTLLLFNLLNFSFLSKRLPYRQRAPSSVAVNIFFITLAVSFSGGHSSNFWVMYLLPIFTACLAFDLRGILWATASILLVLLGFHHASLRERQWIDLLALLIKATTLLAAAGVTMRVASNERSARKRLSEEQDRAEQERRQSREQLQHMDRLATLGTLSASIAHELNSPLATILGFAQMGLSSSAGPAQLRQSLERIEHGARRCRQTIQDMLSFARISKSERTLTDLSALVRECVELKKFDWILSPVKVEARYAAGLPKLALSGPEIQQVLFNLINNAEHAVLARPEGGRILVSTEGDAEHLRVSIEDNGPGIPAQLLERIWEPFFTTKSAGKGTGLGLSIVKRIMEEQGGRITVRSAPEQGACFTLEFPRPKDAPAEPAAAQPAPAPIPAQEQPSRKKKRVYVAEDDPGCIPLLQQLLAPYDCEARFSSDFNEVLEWMRRERPDLLIMDLRMPGMSAAEFLARVDGDARLRELRILPISGSLQGSALETILNSKGLQVLEKPFELDSFRSRLEECLK
ncbi:MAG: hybrid sensor histidine kinase/response regulator [Elusimicrobiota bacterium]|jgi:signal transduction histidine kinase